MFRIVDRGGAVVAASAAVVCVATLSWIVVSGGAVRGGHQPGGYVMVGGADSSATAPSGVPATRSASRSPLAAGTGRSQRATAPGRSTAPVLSARSAPSAVPQLAAASPSPTISEPASARPSTPARPSGPPHGSTPVTATSSSAAFAPARSSARLTVNDLRVRQGDEPRCRDVQVTFGDSGGTPVTSGGAVFTTRVVDAQGATLFTYRTLVGLPRPIEPGAALDEAYTLCVPAGQLPVGATLAAPTVAVRP